MATRLQLMSDLRELAGRSAWGARRLLLDAAEKLDRDQLESLVDNGWQAAERDDIVVQMFEHYRRECLNAARRMTTRRPRSE